MAVRQVDERGIVSGFKNGVGNSSGLSMHQALAVMGKIPGWLLKPAAAFTYDLITRRMSVKGPIVEIGVYRGKYLSVLRSSCSAQTKIVGYDIYPHNQQEIIRRDFIGAFGEAQNICLVKVDSTALSAARVIDDCGGKPIFISIDGSHEADPVLSDLNLAAEILAETGVVALDDFLNPYAVGVNEAFYRCQLDSRLKRRLVPFAFVANKLFLSSEEMADLYRQCGHAFITENIDAPFLETLKKRLERKSHIETNLLSRKVLTIT